jgi:hypothetical protein
LDRQAPQPVVLECRTDTDQEVRFDWTMPGPSIAALSVVVVFDTTGRFVIQEATAGNTLSLNPTDSMSRGNYVWYVLTWNSTCGAAVAGPATFFSTGGSASTP